MANPGLGGSIGPTGRRHPPVRLAAAAVAALLVVGCSTTGKSGTTPETKPGNKATSASRPGELNSAGIDPCKLLREPPQPDLQLEDANASDENTFNGATCIYSAAGQVQYAVTATDGYTLDQFMSARQRSQNASTETDGFPTVSSYDADQPGSCTVAVDTSPTGMIAVKAEDPQATSKGRDAVCRTSLRVAAAALQGLKSQQ